MGSRSEIDYLLREVKRLSDAESKQREVITELGRALKDAEHENCRLEKRVEALEQAGRRAAALSVHRCQTAEIRSRDSGEAQVPLRREPQLDRDLPPSHRAQCGPCLASQDWC